MKRQAAFPNLALWFWPILLVVLGILLLLQNYLILEFNVKQFWPLLLVLLGLQVLIRGDLGISWQAHTFGITRGSVESGKLIANSGELDLRLSALEREGRLIAGQYSANSRPELVADGNRAVLTMVRGRTWLLSLADWEIGLATDLPWYLLLSSYLGEIEVDMQGIIVEQAHVSSGFGDIRVVAPDNPAGHIQLRSSFGNIYLTVPHNMEACIKVFAPPLFGVKLFDANRWQTTDEGHYITPGYNNAVEPLEITVRGTFGDLFLT